MFAVSLLGNEMRVMLLTVSPACTCSLIPLNEDKLTVVPLVVIILTLVYHDARKLSIGAMVPPILS